MDFKQIEALVNVIRYRSFSRAADASFVTQPTISAHIINLEKELGVTLINRYRNEALPTEEGKKLYPFALNMLNLREQAVSELNNNMKLDLDGVISLQSSSVLGEYWLPEKLAQFQKLYPKVKCCIYQSDSDIVEKNILNDIGEVGFLGKSPNKSLNEKKILNDKIVLICPKNAKYIDLYNKRKSIDVKELIDENFIWREQGSATRKTFEKEAEKLGLKNSDINVIALANSIESIKKLVEKGVGVSVLSEITTKGDKKWRDYLAFDIDGIDCSRDFYMIWNKNIVIPPIVEMFIEFIEDN